MSSAQRASEGLFASGEGNADPHWRVTARRLVSYEVRVCQDLLDPGNPALLATGTPDSTRRRLVVVDQRVGMLFGDRLRRYLAAYGGGHEICLIDAHERVKTMDSVLKVVRAMDEFGVGRRREPVIAIGGGVLTDIVGLATSLYRRSTPYVRVPTTLIGMVDAGIGAKTGVNFHEYKNRLGSYHPAEATLVDPAFLATLPARHIRNGLAEILKIALVKDAGLLDLLAEHGPRLVAERMQRRGAADGGAAARAVMHRAIHGMLQELQPNLWEHRLERVVDYGHSFSPTIEMAALPELLHGEAVCVDMALTTVIARNRGLLTGDEAARARSVMDTLGLPCWHRVCAPELLVAALADTVRHRDGRQLMPLPAGIGDACFVNDVTPAEIERAVAEVAEPARMEA
ncbi:sedoheptulose 7-phosphate cyclase [Dactylosporangium sp. CA-139114]|uniref:sedoheptulose 7-phosphate cyclase n=1 Tax=Dactylosporangium sp. CA-139114 TaxID=3239931 RepID=UPI003D98F68E